jgi:hypothetical protein
MSELPPSRTGERSPQSAPNLIEFHYIKSSFFRVVYAEGAYGGLTPRGKIYFSLYNERPAIPRRTEMQFSEDGETAVGPERITDTRGGIVREVEAEILMDVSAAVEFHNWLGERIQQWKAMSKEIKKNAK